MSKSKKAQGIAVVAESNAPAKVSTPNAVATAQAEKEKQSLKQRVLNLLNEGAIDKATAYKLCPALERMEAREVKKKNAPKISAFSCPVENTELNGYVLDNTIDWKVKKIDGMQVLVPFIKKQND